jgi:hypothetical protein
VSVPALGAPAAAVTAGPPADDPTFGFLAEAFDPAVARPVLTRALGAPVHEVSARLLRHRARRRLLVRFDLGTDAGPRTMLGKARAKGADRRTQRLMTALRAAGFDEAAADGIAVPDPLAVVHRWRMVLHAWVDGQTVTSLLGEPGSEARLRLADRMVDALAKLRAAPVVVARKHTLADELAGLQRQFADVVAAAPHLEPRLRRIAAGCRRLVARLPPAVPCLSHRDFYPDQVLVAGDRTYLVDLDLVARAHPALDAGNVIAHLVEHALRVDGDANALDDVVARVRARGAALASPDAVAVFTTLSLARLVAVGHRIAARRGAADPLLRLVEARLVGA